MTVKVEETVSFDEMSAPELLAGDWPVLTYEQALFNVARHITHNEYEGGYWEVHLLSNGGFLPILSDPNAEFTCHHPDGWSGKLKGEAFAVAVNIFVCSHLSFQAHDENDDALAKILSENYYRLRDYFLQDDNNPFETDTIRDILKCID